MNGEFLAQVFAQNPVGAWFVAGGVLLGVFVLLRLLRYGTEKWLSRLQAQRPRPGLRVALEFGRRTTRLFLFAVALFAASLALDLPPTVRHGIQTFTLSVFFFQLALWGSYLVGVWLTRLSERKLKEEGDAATATTLHALTVIVKFALWTLAALLILENLGVHVGSLLAGLGIAGIAVALAVQNVLGDLFAALSIVVDKPFTVGDFIVFGNERGRVERIGLKTTRIRSLTGEELVVSNTDLLRQQIHNFRRMQERRCTFTFGVVYDTPPEKLARIPHMVREIIESLADTRFERAHFKEFGAYALTFEVVYWMLKPDFNLFMDTQQAINLALVRRFQEEGIAFAFPTQVVYLAPPAKEVSLGTGREDSEGTGSSP